MLLSSTYLQSLPSVSPFGLSLRSLIHGLVQTLIGDGEIH